ncbi:MAG: signal peptidase II [Spirochaetales bacterium]|nr:signal peptidase II [Spirochaetales bacterium]
MKEKLLPFTASGVVVLIDQFTKWLVVRSISPFSIAWSSGPGDFLRIIHVKNRVIAFSIGDSLPDVLRVLLFIILPLIIITVVIAYLLKSNDFSPLQRWAAALMIGGGAGNLIDRIFRSSGVIDFIDFKFFGLFGLERWPTFNAADSSIVIGGVLLIISLIFEYARQEKI